ncbi:MAG: hypothetical protein LBI27_10380 [Clostridiales bacterium]|jgi:hypothetical protein|nr:hypothetical protein [Clostridiales bacterium]
MREFFMLITQLLFIAILQVILADFLDDTKWAVKIINIACISICYFLLVKYVYNQFAWEISVFMNYF